MVNNNSPKPYCAVATQARFAGPQDMSVLGVAPGASADGTAHLAIRVGRILLYIEDRGRSPPGPRRGVGHSTWPTVSSARWRTPSPRRSVSSGDASSARRTGGSGQCGDEPGP